MTATCQACAAPSPAAFLCRHCETELAGMLADLPWWIDRLTEAAIGQAKLGDGGRHNRAAGLTQYTDEQPAVDEQGFYAGMTRGQQRLERDLAAGKFILDKALAMGRVNARAARLAGRVRSNLAVMLWAVCQAHAVPVSSVRAIPPGFVGPLLPNDIRGVYHGRAQLASAWLSDRVTWISADERAGEWFTAVRHLVGGPDTDGEISKVINRPVPMRWLGKCPTWNEQTRSVCGAELRCRQDAPEVFCRQCRQTHNPDRLQLLLMNDLERKKLTISRILEVNRMQPAEYRISERTLRHWRQTSKLKPRGWKRPDGREAPTRHSDADEPLYLWADIRKLRAGC